MAFPEQIGFSARKKAENWTPNHTRVIEDRRDRSVQPIEIKFSQAIDDTSVSAEARGIRDECLGNIPRMFKIEGTYITISMDSQILTANPELGAKKSVSAQLARQIDVVAGEQWNVTLVASQVRVGYSRQSDLIHNDGEGIIDDGMRASALGDMFGCALEELDFEARCGLLSSHNRGMDMRHLALKSYLLLEQSILHHTMVGLQLQALTQKTVVAARTSREVLNGYIHNDLVVDCADLSNQQVKLLVGLCMQWPFSRCIDGVGNADVYSIIGLEAESSFLYTSSGAAVEVEGPLSFGHPDELYVLITQLFDHFGAADHLLEVFKEARGLAPMVKYVLQASGEKSIALGLKYPISHGSNKIGVGVDRKLKISLASHFQSSSASMVLDFLMGELCKSRMHCVGEKLGLYNHVIYEDLETARVLGMLRDHGYVQRGESSGLSAEVAPWMQCLTMAGDYITQWLLMHAMEIRQEQRVDNDLSSVILPLLKFSDKRVPISSDETINGKHKVTGDSLLSPTMRIDATPEIRRNILWLQSLGFDDIGLSKGGMSWVGTGELPYLNNGMRRRCSNLAGDYSLHRVQVILPDAVPTRDPRAHIHHMFRKPELTMMAAQPGVESYEDRPIVRRYRTSGGMLPRTSTDSLRYRKESDELEPEQALTPTRLFQKNTFGDALMAAHKAKVNRDANQKSDIEGKVAAVRHKLMNYGESEEAANINSVAATDEDQFVQIAIPEGEVVDVPPDGDCGLHAVVRALNYMSVKATMEDAKVRMGVKGMPQGVNWTDDALAALARDYGYDLIVHDLEGNNAHLHADPSNQGRRLYLEYAGLDQGRYGHYRIIRPRRNDKNRIIKAARQPAQEKEEAVRRMLKMEDMMRPGRLRNSTDLTFRAKAEKYLSEGETRDRSRSPKKEEN